MAALIRASTATLKLVAASSVLFPSFVGFCRVSRVCSLFLYDTILKVETNNTPIYVETRVSGEKLR